VLNAEFGLASKGRQTREVIEKRSCQRYLNKARLSSFVRLCWLAWKDCRPNILAPRNSEPDGKCYLARCFCSCVADGREPQMGCSHNCATSVPLSMKLDETAKLPCYCRRDFHALPQLRPLFHKDSTGSRGVCHCFERPRTAHSWQCHLAPPDAH
jgi:hypothetical protein